MLPGEGPVNYRETGLLFEIMFEGYRAMAAFGTASLPRFSAFLVGAASQTARRAFSTTSSAPTSTGCRTVRGGARPTLARTRLAVRPG